MVGSRRCAARSRPDQEVATHLRVDDEVRVRARARARAKVRVRARARARVRARVRPPRWRRTTPPP